MHVIAGEKTIEGSEYHFVGSSDEMNRFRNAQLAVIGEAAISQIITPEETINLTGKLTHGSMYGQVVTDPIFDAALPVVVRNQNELVEQILNRDHRDEHVNFWQILQNLTPAEADLFDYSLGSASKFLRLVNAEGLGLDTNSNSGYLNRQLNLGPLAIAAFEIEGELFDGSNFDELYRDTGATHEAYMNPVSWDTEGNPITVMTEDLITLGHLGERDAFVTDFVITAINK